MANPAAHTINNLAGNAALNQPAGDTIDTNGSVSIPAGSVTDKMILHVTNAAAAAIAVTVKAGNNPPAIRASLGDLVVNVGAANSGTDKAIIGPFESARFVQADGSVNVSYQAAANAPNLNVRIYRLPKAV